MRRVARWSLAGVLLATMGCGGPEFVAATGSEEAGIGADGSAVDATVGNEGGVSEDGSVPTDGKAPKKDGAVGADASEDGGTGAVDGGDAGNPGDGAPPPFACPSTDPSVVFCSDFDNTNTAPWDWQSDPTTGSGTDTADTTNFISSPNGFASATGALIAGDGYTIASLGYPFSSVAGRVDYVFHMFVKQADALVSIPLAQLIIDPTTSSALSLQLVLKGGQLQLSQIYPGSDGGQQTTNITVGAVTTSAWVEVEMLLDRRTASPTMAVSINNVLKLTAQTATAPASQNLEVDLGILGLLPISTANSITFDNVTVRAY